ncbi:uncharacterized protein LOC135108367 [Scylla paramamosain]
MASSTNASATRTRRTTMRGATIKTPEQKTAPTTPPPHSHWPTPPTPRCLFSPRWAARSPAVKGNEEKARMSTLPICRLLSSGFESDLTLTFKDGIPDLKVHRMVLAMHSPVFRRMLSRDWGDRNEIKMNDDFTATYWLMHHLYCGLRYLRSWDVALEVLYMADAYCIPTAGRLATEVLMRHLDKSTFWSIFQVAAHLSNERLLSACDQYLEEHTDDLLESFPTISRVAALRVLSSPSFKPSSEMRVFTSLIKWGRYQIPEGEKLQATSTKGSRPLPSTSSSTSSLHNETRPLPSPSSSTSSLHNETLNNQQLRAELEEFLPEVRFLSMTITEVIRDVMSYEVLTSQEGIMLLRVMSGCPDASLPDIASCQISSPRCRAKVEDVVQGVGRGKGNGSGTVGPRASSAMGVRGAASRRWL